MRRLKAQLMGMFSGKSRNPLDSTYLRLTQPQMFAEAKKRGSGGSVADHEREEARQQQARAEMFFLECGLVPSAKSVMGYHNI